VQGGDGRGHRGPCRPGAGVASSDDPAGAVCEHAGRAAYGAARRGGPGTRGLGRGRAERRAAAFRHDAITTIGQALESADVPGEWRTRMLALLAMLERVGVGDLDAVTRRHGKP